MNRWLHAPVLALLSVAFVAVAVPSVSATDPPAVAVSVQSSGPTPTGSGEPAPPAEETDPGVPTPANEADPTTTVPVDTPGDGGAAPTDTVAPGLPGTAPPGFSEEQYRRFINSVVTCGVDPGRVCTWVYSWTGNSGLAETMQWIVDIPLKILILFAVAILANRFVRRTVIRRMERAERRRFSDDAAQATDPERVRRAAQRSATVASTIGGALTVAIFTITGLVALAEIGINIGPLLAGAGIAGIALGFGAQNLVRDVLAGLFVVVEDQYGVGDIIDVGRTTGVVEGISLRITKVRDIHGTLWFVPNGEVAELGNLTQMWSRAIIDFDIDYRADHDRAGEIIKTTADRVWQDPDSPVRILEEPELWGVESLGDSSVVIRIAVKTAPSEQWKVARLLRGAVKKALDAEGIEIPFPQHTVWIHGDPDSAPDLVGTPGGDRQA